jgi:hypothetical protein
MKSVLMILLSLVSIQNASASTATGNYECTIQQTGPKEGDHKILGGKALTADMIKSLKEKAAVNDVPQVIPVATIAGTAYSLEISFWGLTYVVVKGTQQMKFTSANFVSNYSLRDLANPEGLTISFVCQQEVLE